MEKGKLNKKELLNVLARLNLLETMVYQPFQLVQELHELGLPELVYYEFIQSDSTEMKRIGYQCPTISTVWLRTWYEEERPNLRFTNERIMGVLKHPNCPEDILWDAVNSPAGINIQNQVLQNPNCPSDLLEVLLQKNEAFSVGVAKHANCPSRLLEQLSKMRGTDIRRAVAKNPNCPFHVLSRYAKLKDEGVKESVLKNPNTPASVLYMIDCGDNSYLEMLLAKHPNTNDGRLCQLAMESTKGVVVEALANRVMEPELIEKLYRNGTFQLRMALAKAGQLSIELKLDFAETENTSILFNELKKTGTVADFELVAQLAGPKVRAELARRDFCPPSVLASLIEEGDYRVMLKLLLNPNCPPETLASYGRGIDHALRCRVARNGSTPVQILVELAKEGDEDIAYQLAKNPNAPQSLLFAIASSSSLKVREAIVRNQACSTTLLLLIAQKELSKDVLQRIVIHRNCPDEFLDLIQSRKADFQEEDSIWDEHMLLMDTLVKLKKEWNRK